MSPKVATPPRNPEQEGQKPNWKNRTLLHGDNLDFLRSMNSGTVDLIATDPPFNKNRDFHATPDSLAKGASFQDRWSWKKDVHEEWVDKITDDFPNVMNVIQGSRNSYGDDMGAFLCFMGVRLLEMYRILKPVGIMYLHCDPTASHYLKELMDAIFGSKNFRNEIVWCYRKWTNKTDGFQKNHDIILRYSKSDKFYHNAIFDENAPQHKKWERGWDVNVVEGGTKQLIIYDKKKAKEKIELGNYDRVIYRDVKSRGVNMPDWWEIPIINSQAKERTGYPTQKPLALYERIIMASSNKDDVILDPFCGCATTCVASEKLNRQWIGIDIWDKAHEVVIDRLKKEGCLSDTDEEREDLIHTKGTITYSKKPLKRTDGGSEAVPFMETKLKEFDDTGRDPYTNAQKKEMLLEKHGSVCQGCGIALHERYLELDHQLPRADGGSNLLGNRILLCGPCNKLKRHLYTISWLRRENKKLGYMVNEKMLSNLKQ